MTATTTIQRVRYSNGEVDVDNAAKSLPWEIPVPVNSFWDSYVYCTATSFLQPFSDSERAQLPIDPNSTDSHETKTHLLLKLIKEKLAKEETKVLPEVLYEKDYKKWYVIWQGIYAMEDALNLPEAEQTVRMLVEKRPDKDNVVPPHMLAEHLVKIGKYAEAVEVERPVLKWMEERPNLGPSTPQALNARRIIAKALWFQGEEKRGEAEKVVAEIQRLTEEMSGRFEVYKEEERKLNQEMMDKIKGTA